MQSLAVLLGNLGGNITVEEVNNARRTARSVCMWSLSGTVMMLSVILLITVPAGNGAIPQVLLGVLCALLSITLQFCTPENPPWILHVACALAITTSCLMHITYPFMMSSSIAVVLLLWILVPNPRYSKNWLMANMIEYIATGTYDAIVHSYQPANVLLVCLGFAMVMTFSLVTVVETHHMHATHDTEMELRSKVGNMDEVLVSLRAEVAALAVSRPPSDHCLIDGCNPTRGNTTHTLRESLAEFARNNSSAYSRQSPSAGEVPSLSLNSSAKSMKEIQDGEDDTPQTPSQITRAIRKALCQTQHPPPPDGMWLPSPMMVDLGDAGSPPASPHGSPLHPRRRLSQLTNNALNPCRPPPAPSSPRFDNRRSSQSQSQERAPQLWSPFAAIGE